MRHVLIGALSASLVLIAGAASAQAGRSAAASRTTQVRPPPEAPATDPNSDLARRRAAIAQGFSPIDTSLLGRGFNR